MRVNPFENPLRNNSQEKEKVERNIKKLNEAENSLREKFPKSEIMAMFRASTIGAIEKAKEE